MTEAPRLCGGARLAVREDARPIARIYNEGIEDRLATFETRPRTVSEVVGWLESGFPLLVVERDREVLARCGAHSVG